jgi:hypothetical protein
MTVSILARVCGGMLACCLVAPAFAQTNTPPPRDFTTYRPSLPGTRITAAQAPNIDGDISDPVWQKAPAIDEFYQLEPHEGAPGDEKTVVRACAVRREQSVFLDHGV